MIDDVTTHLHVLTVRLHIPQAQSLKDKRMVVKSLKEQIRNKFNVSIAELGGLDKWQVAILGIAMLGNENRLLHSTAQNIITFIERFGLADLCETDIQEY